MKFIYDGKTTRIANKTLISTNEGIGLYQVILEIQSEFGWEVHKTGCAYLNENGSFAVKGIFDMASPFSNGLAIVGQNFKMGVINKSARFVLSNAYDVVTPYTPEEFEKISSKANIDSRITKKQLLTLETFKTKIPSNGKLHVKQGQNWQEVSVAHAMNNNNDLQK